MDWRCDSAFARVTAVHRASQLAVSVDGCEVVEALDVEIAFDCGWQLRAVEDVAVALAEVLHRLCECAGDRLRELVPESCRLSEWDLRNGYCGRGLGDGWQAGFYSHVRRRSV